MKYNKIDSSLFIKNRKNFVKKLESNSIAFFNSEGEISPEAIDLFGPILLSSVPKIPSP